MNQNRKEFGPWSKQTSSSGREYYYNKDTEVSQWEKPKEWREFELEQEQHRTQLRESPSLAGPMVFPPFGIPPPPMAFPPPPPFMPGFPPPPIGVGAPPPFAQFPPPPHMPPMSRHVPPVNIGMPMNSLCSNMPPAHLPNKFRSGSGDSFNAQPRRPDSRSMKVERETPSSTPRTQVSHERNWVEKTEETCSDEGRSNGQANATATRPPPPVEKKCVKRERVEVPTEVQQETREVKKVKEEASDVPNWRLYYNPQLAKEKRSALKLDSDKDLRELVLLSLQLENRLVAELMKMKTASALVAVQEHEVLLCKGKIINLQEQQKALEQREHIRAREMVLPTLMPQFNNKQ